METYSIHTTIRDWAEDDRPREKMMLKGRQSMSDAELLAILIGSGTKNDSAVDLAKEILHRAHDNLTELSKMNLNDLVAVRGIGKARATIILAALELSRRRNESCALERDKIKTSRDAYEIFKSILGDQPYEEFWIILLNKANKVLKRCNISEGGISGTVVDPKKIFKISLDHHASSIILGHNHPSGVVTPSEADQRITKKIREAGAMLEVMVLDHLIIGENGYYSFADDGAM